MADPLSQDSVHGKIAEFGQLHNSGKISEAKQLLGELLQSYPDNADIHYLVGVMCAGERQYGEAKDFLSKAIGANDNHYQAYHALGKVHCILEELSDARQCFVRAVEIKPDFVDAIERLAELLYYGDDLAALEKVLQRLVMFCPDNSDAYSRLGVVLYRKRQFDDAVACYRKAVAIDPLCASAYNNLGCVLLDKGFFQDAVEAHVRALEILVHKPGLMQSKRLVKQPMDGSLAWQALCDVDDLLSREGVRYFLGFGTLLGFIREGNFLSHDKDIDICLFDENAVDKIISKFAPQASFSPKNLLRASFTHDNGIAVDLFIHHKEKERLVTGLDNTAERFVWKFTPFELTEREFLGRTFLIPENYQTYLQELYGDWKTPDPEFNTKVLAPNIADKFNRNHLSRSLNALYDCLRNGKFEAALRYCRFIKSGVGNDMEVLDALESLLLKKGVEQ